MFDDKTPQKEQKRAKNIGKNEVGKSDKKAKRVQKKQILPKTKKKPTLKAYKGRGKYRVQFTPGKETEIRNMLMIGDDYKLFEYANVTWTEYLDLKRAGLAELSDGQEKAILNRKQKIKLDGSIAKPEIKLPGQGILISQFAEQFANIIKTKNTLFYRIDQKAVVEVGKIKSQKTGEEIYTGFIPIKASRLITFIEKYITPGSICASKDDPTASRFVKESIKRETANTVLCSEILEGSLQQIERIFTVPIPIIVDGEISFPCKGYDERFCSWLPHDAPEITNPEMSLEDAKELIKKMFAECCFKTEQDRCNAIAGLLTPFLKGLYPAFNTRPPILFYLGNRERTGKDYLAGITGCVFVGSPTEETPISTEDTRQSNSSEELRKKVLAAFITGQKRMHFANCKGQINNAVFEALATMETFSDRLLGKNVMLGFPNEMDFSLSGNAGVTYTPDFAARCIFIRLFLAEENANLRTFKNPDLQGWVKKNRGEILSALYALVRNWFEAGKPKGKQAFASYNAWAEICGGIMETAGYGNPCEPDAEPMLIGGDMETEDMKALFELCYKKSPDSALKKSEIKEIVIHESNLFSYLDFDTKSGQTKLGIIISKFEGRILSGILLNVVDKKTRSDRQEFVFLKKIVKNDKEEILEKKEGNEPEPD